MVDATLGPEVQPSMRTRNCVCERGRAIDSGKLTRGGWRLSSVPLSRGLSQLTAIQSETGPVLPFTFRMPCSSSHTPLRSRTGLQSYDCRWMVNFPPIYNKLLYVNKTVTGVAYSTTFSRIRFEPLLDPDEGEAKEGTTQRENWEQRRKRNAKQQTEAKRTHCKTDRDSDGQRHRQTGRRRD